MGDLRRITLTKNPSSGIWIGQYQLAQDEGTFEYRYLQLCNKIFNWWEIPEHATELDIVVSDQPHTEAYEVTLKTLKVLKKPHPCYVNKKGLTISGPIFPGYLSIINELKRGYRKRLYVRCEL